MPPKGLGESAGASKKLGLQVVVIKQHQGSPLPAWPRLLALSPHLLGLKAHVREGVEMKQQTRELHSCACAHAVLGGNVINVQFITFSETLRVNTVSPHHY